MKTFDEAALSVLNSYENDFDTWHSNYCRCAEISTNEKMADCLSLILARNLVGCNMLDFEDLVTRITRAVKKTMELGIAIGQEMEKP